MTHALAKHTGQRSIDPKTRAETNGRTDTTACNTLPANVVYNKSRSCIELQLQIHRVTVTYFRSISMPAGFRRHFVGKTLMDVSYCDILKYALLVS